MSIKTVSNISILFVTRAGVKMSKFSNPFEADQQTQFKEKPRFFLKVSKQNHQAHFPTSFLNSNYYIKVNDIAIFIYIFIINKNKCKKAVDQK